MNSTSDAIAAVIRDRRTVSSFKPERPPESLILEGIELARWAPNHRHTEPWMFHLIGSETASRIVELNAQLVSEAKGPEAGEAKRKRWSSVPGWMAMTCEKSDDGIRESEDYAACCCSVQNLSLYLWSNGVGMKWSTGEVTRREEFYELLHVDPAERFVVGLFWYGYPEKVPQQKRRPVEEITTGLA